MKQSPRKIVSVHLNVQIFVNQEREQGNLLLDQFLDTALDVLSAPFSEHFIAVDSEYLCNLMLADVHIHKVLVRELHLSREGAVVQKANLNELLKQQQLF